MTYSCFDVSIDDQIAHIVLKRPEKRNSMIPEFWDELPVIIADIESRAAARVIVVSSTGPHFSAGLDLNAFASLMATPPNKEGKLQAATSFYQQVQKMQQSFSCLEDCRIPVLAAIQGGAIGAAVDLVTACDMRYMTQDAFFTIYEIKVGMTADVGTFPRICKLLPEGLVRELAYTGRKFSAEEALTHGFVNRVFTDQQTLLAGVMEVARDIASNPPLAVYGCKRMINYARDHTIADSLDYISLWNASHFKPEEVMEAIAASTQKRAGEFVDLPPVRDRVATD